MHHAGLLPIVRELTELLFARGFIKILFCTETMSVGINLPVKTTIFTDVTKFNGEIMRTLYSHEYTQAAGRAGRLGLDTVGHVIHLNNLFRNVEHSTYKQMMNGKPQILTSKFKISYNLLLNLIDIGDSNIVKFAGKSMVIDDINNQIKATESKIAILTNELDNIKQCCAILRTPNDILEKFIELQKNKTTSVNKKRKDIERQLQQIHDNYKYVEQDKVTYQKIGIKEKEINDEQIQLNNTTTYIQSGVTSVINLLKDDGYINDDIELDLTIKGKIASQLREINCLVFAELLENKTIDMLTSKQMVLLFSCFTNISVQDDFKDIVPSIEDKLVINTLEKVKNMCDMYQEKEVDYNINTGLDYNIHYDLLKYTDEWCDAKSIEECKLVLQKLGEEKEVFLGEFVKAILKINNITCEMEKIAELTGNIAFLSKLREIPNMTMKYVVTNQSLYV
jgi:superfamily II RNA helicase